MASTFFSSTMPAMAGSVAAAAAGPPITPALARSLVPPVLPAWRLSMRPFFSSLPPTPLALLRHLSAPSRPNQPALSPFVIAAVNPLLLRFYSGSSLAQPRREFSTGTSTFGSPSARSSLLARFAPPIRSFSNGVSRTILARAEANANRNPQSPSSQNVFYSMLLAANMPQIVVERYSSGHFARNESCDEMYRRAYSMLNIDPSQTATPTPAQIQAVGQAIAAKTQGANIAVADMPPTVAISHAAPAGALPPHSHGPPASASPSAPLHVRIDETNSSVLFKWIKFIAWFALITYLSLMLVTILIDSLSMVPKRPGTRGQTEVKPENQKARFTDVLGCDEAKEELQDLVEFLKNPDKFNTLGGKLPKGVLLVGPPGTGKTLLARAVAGEAGVPFFYMSGSEFDEVYVGVGAKRVRELFGSAKAKSPSIIFIDELDAMGGRRHSRDAAYVKQTLNQLLTELDGFDQNSGVIIIGATNFPESLDRALTRPGRFDRRVVVGLPDARGRIAILRHHLSKIKAAEGIDVEGIAVTTAGLSGAELENIVNEAAVHASKKKAIEVTQKDFEWAKDKVIMGAERRTMVIDPKEKEMTAYHEAGHALLRWYTDPDALHKVTILPRGMTLGHMAQRPKVDKHSRTATDYEHYLLVAYGGFVAEELVFGLSKTTDGVSSDIEQATKTAFRMVARFGMSKELGPVEFNHMYNSLSATTKAAVEKEVQGKLLQAYSKAKKLLTDNRKDLDTLAQALLKFETLDREEVAKVLKGEDLPNRVPVPPGPMFVHPSGEEGGGITSDDNEPPSVPPRPPPPPPPSPMGSSRPQNSANE